MKKLAMWAGILACAILIDKPSPKKPTQIVNNYFIKSGGCGGKCGGCHGH